MVINMKYLLRNKLLPGITVIGIMVFLAGCSSLGIFNGSSSEENSKAKIVYYTPGQIKNVIDSARQKYLKGLILYDERDSLNADLYFEDAVNILYSLDNQPAIELNDEYTRLVESLVRDYFRFTQSQEEVSSKSAVYHLYERYVEPLEAAGAGKKGRSTVIKPLSIKIKEIKDPDYDYRKELDSLQAERQKMIPPKLPEGTDTNLVLENPKTDIPLVLNKYVQENLDFLTKGHGRRWVQIWLERGGKWFPMLKRIAKEVDVPKELIYSALIESGLRTEEVSPAQAVGMWQFINSTAQMYGLNNPQSVWVDERRDPEKSTYAALRHYKDLYFEFGDWYLAIAAYNCGVGCVKRALKKSDKEKPDFWDIRDYLPKETRNHVPLYIAVTMIFLQPERYGFYDNDYNIQEPFKYQWYTLHEPVSLKAIALCAGTTIDEIQELNPELLKGYTPPNVPEYTIRIPFGSKELFARNFSRLTEKEKRPWFNHTVSKGETIKSISKDYGISTGELLSANNMTDEDAKLSDGSELLIPVDLFNGFDEEQGDDYYTYGARFTDYETHIAKYGETLYSISQRYSVPLTLLRKVNSISSEGDKLIPGTKLKIPYRREVSGYGYKYSYQDTPRIVKHTVENGEDLASIAEQYDVSVESIKKLNRMNSGSIYKGSVLKIRTYVTKDGYNPGAISSSFEKNRNDNGSAPARVPRFRIIHKVKPDDSLDELAEMYKVSADDIKHWNKSKIKGETLYKGTRLKIYPPENYYKEKSGK